MLSSVQLSNTLSARCVMCLPPKVKSLLLLFLSPLPSFTNSTPFPLEITKLLSVSLCYFYLLIYFCLTPSPFPPSPFQLMNIYVLLRFGLGVTLAKLEKFPDPCNWCLADLRDLHMCSYM